MQFSYELHTIRFEERVTWLGSTNASPVPPYCRRFGELDECDIPAGETRGAIRGIAFVRYRHQSGTRALERWVSRGRNFYLGHKVSAYPAQKQD